MKFHRLPLALSLTVLGACTVQESSSTEAAAAEPTLLAPGEVTIPTDEEAAAAATKAIDDSNADAELEKLKQEIGGGK